jgi:hypothetical protein
MSRDKCAVGLLVVLLLSTCGPSMARVEHTSGYVLLWQVDKLLAIRPGTADVREVHTKTSLDNIVDVNGSVDALVVVSSAGVTPLLSVRVINLRTGDLIREITSNAGHADVDSSRRRLAFSAYARENDGSYDVIITDFAAGELDRGLPQAAGPASCISWNRRTSSLAFDADGRIFEWTEGDLISRVEGMCPSWSPDGHRLALRRGTKTIYVYDAKIGKVTELYRRGVTESEFTGPMFWSPDQRFIAATVHSGLDGHGKQCLAVDTTTKRPTLIHEGSAFCGPWLTDAP